MPLILTQLTSSGRYNLLIVLGKENIERMKEKDPFELRWTELPIARERPATIGISYATDSEMMQMEQLARQGKTNEAIKMATAGFKYRPEWGDHDLGPQRFT